MIAAVKREEKNSRQILKSAERLKKKNKLQNVVVNSFGDVDVDSYTNNNNDDVNDDDINEMHDNNDRVYQAAEREREELIYKRIQTLMSSFGIKKHKLLSLIMNKGEKGEEPQKNSGVNKAKGEDLVVVKKV
jgi:hypothetical protein